MTIRNDQPRRDLFGAVSRRGLLKGAAALAAVRTTPVFAVSGSIFAYVGSYTPNGPGISIYHMDPSTGDLDLLKTVTSSNPSWLTFDRPQNTLYAVNEDSVFNGKHAGSVSAFKVNKSTGDLTLLNVVSSQGAVPAHGSVHPSGKWFFVSNYIGANVAVLPIHSDGRLGEAVDLEPISGPLGPMKAVDAPPGSFANSGHDASHAHAIESDPAGKFVFVTDLGTDRIFIFKFDATTGKLTPNAQPFEQESPGAGPRHFAFHPNGLWFYVINEEASTISFLLYDPTAGTLMRKQTLSSLPAGFKGTNFTSEIRVSSDGRFVLGANRLLNSIATLAIGPTGELTHVDNEWTRGDYPRSFTFDPTNNFVFVCHNRNDVVTSFRYNAGTGKLTFTKQWVGVGSPSSIVFLQT